MEHRQFRFPNLQEYEEAAFFLEHLRGSELHWFFSQAAKSAHVGAWLPAAITFLTGIENSLRITVSQVEGEDLSKPDADLGKTLSNSLLYEALKLGLPVKRLAFPGESKFEEAIKSRKPDVTIVRARHDLCHGNLLPFADRDPALGGEAIITPECLEPLVQTLGRISYEWVLELGTFRAERGL